MSIIAVPVYLHVLGAEAYGLVGLFASLQLVFTFLDFGLSGAVNREVARNCAAARPVSENRTLLRSSEVVFWAVGILVAGSVCAASGWFATNWLQVSALPQAEVRLALTVMGLSLGLRWPVSLYNGMLQGLERQVLMNSLAIGATSARVLGSLAVILWIQPSITVFALAQAVASAIEVALVAVVTWHAVGPNGLARFQWSALAGVWRFALAFNVVGVLGTIMSQADRFVISKFLPLEQLGMYSVAATASGGLPLIGASLATAVFPRFSARVAVADWGSLAREYHRAVQAIAFPAVGVAFALAFFARGIIHTWTRSAQVAQASSPVVVVLAIAYLLNALANPAYTLLLAKGDTHIPIVANAMGVVLLVPLMIASVRPAGIAGVAAILLVFSGICFLVYSHFVWRITRSTPTGASLARSLFPFIALGVVWFGAGRLLCQVVAGELLRVAVLLAVGLGYCATAGVIFFGIDAGELVTGASRWLKEWPHRGGA